jgi:hypothetical protein
MKEKKFLKRKDVVIPTEICVGLSCVPLAVGLGAMASGAGGIELTTIGIGGLTGTGIAVAEKRLEEFIKKHGKKKISKVV